MLMENGNLKELDISANEIGDDGMRNFSEGLIQNNTLTKLMLYNCEISVKGNYSYFYNINVTTLLHTSKNS